MTLDQLFLDLKSQGIELSEISNKTGIPVNTINNIRRGKTKKPRSYTLKAIADAFGYELIYENDEPHFYKKTNGLQKRNIEKSSKDLAGDIPEEGFRFPPADLSKPPIPIIGIGEAGANGIVLEEQLAKLPYDYQEFLKNQYWEGDNDYCVTRPHDISDVTAYAVRVEGDSMSPFLKPGAIVIASPIKKCVSGNLAVVKVKDNSTYIKEVYFQEGDIIQLKSYNPAYPDKILPRDRIEFCHKIVWIKPSN